MKVAALVPFKCFTRAKRRLRAHYSDAQVEQLGRALLSDVLDALAHAKRLERYCVLTDDSEVGALARAAGAEVRLRRPDPGLNPALDAAEHELADAGYGASLVVLGDLPLLEAEHVDRVIELGASHEVVLVPSNDGGTALLLRRPPACIPARFGPESARAHREAAERAGLAVSSLDALGAEMAIDLDTPEDARRLLALGRRCRTRTLLEAFEA